MKYKKLTDAQKAKNKIKRQWKNYKKWQKIHKGEFTNSATLITNFQQFKIVMKTVNNNVSRLKDLKLHLYSRELARNIKAAIKRQNAKITENAIEQGLVPTDLSEVFTIKAIQEKGQDIMDIREYANIIKDDINAYREAHSDMNKSELAKAVSRQFFGSL